MRLSHLQLCTEEEAAAARQRLEELWLRTQRLRRPSDIAQHLKKDELENRWVRMHIRESAPVVVILNVCEAHGICSR